MRRITLSDRGRGLRRLVSHVNWYAVGTDRRPIFMFAEADWASTPFDHDTAPVCLVVT